MKVPEAAKPKEYEFRLTQRCYRELEMKLNYILKRSKPMVINAVLREVTRVYSVERADRVVIGREFTRSNKDFVIKLKDDMFTKRDLLTDKVW